MVIVMDVLITSGALPVLFFLLAGSQHDDGAWRLDWPSALDSDCTEEADAWWSEPIRVTGHHLEWMVLRPKAPPEAHRLQRAIHYLVNRLSCDDEDFMRVPYTDWSHALRALTLWRDASRKQVGNSY